MLLRTVLTLGVGGLAVGVWVAAVSMVRTHWKATREWPRAIGKVGSVFNPLRPVIEVEQGIEFTAPLPQTDGPSPYGPNERILQMESDEGLRPYRRVEFLVDPATARARVTRGVGVAPFPLALLGLVYLLAAGGFWLVTIAPTEPGRWTYYQAPPWSDSALLSSRFGAWPILQFALGAAVGAFGLVMRWTSPSDSVGTRASICSVVLFVAGVFAVLALDKATYRLEVDTSGLRESSALGWRVAPWGTIRGAVEETTSYFGRRSPRSSTMLDRVSRRVFFTDAQGREAISIADGLNPAQSKALLDHVLAHTMLRPEKRELKRLLFNYTD